MIQLIIDRVIAHQTRCTVSLADVASLPAWFEQLPLAHDVQSSEDLRVLGYAGPAAHSISPVVEKILLMKKGPKLIDAFTEICHERASRGISTIVIVSSLSYHAVVISDEKVAPPAPSPLPA